MAPIEGFKDKFRECSERLEAELTSPSMRRDIAARFVVIWTLLTRIPLPQKWWPETMPPDMKQLIGAMCKLNPSERQTAQKLAHLPMFHGLQPRDGYLVVEKAKRPPPKTPSAHAARVSHAAKSTTSVGMMKVQASNSRKNIISSIVTTVPAAKPGSVPLKMSKMMS